MQKLGYSLRLAALILLVTNSVATAQVPSMALAQARNPQPPIDATAESCAEYRSALYQQIQAIYKRSSECMRKGPSWSSYAGSEEDRRPWCTPGPPPRLSAQVTAYPDCAIEQEALCEAYEAQYTQVPACFSKVSQSKQAKERQLAIANDMIETHKRFKRAESIVWNPEVFLREVVLPRLPSHVKAKLDMYENMAGNEAVRFNALKPLPATVDLTTFEMPRELSKKGTGMMQELYDYLFGGTVGNKKLRSGNPVIAAIQGDAASKIKAVQSSMLGEMEQATNLMDSFISPSTSYTRPASAVAPHQRSAVSKGRLSREHPDCSLLDGSGRTDLVNREPELYERLVELCN